MDYLDYVKHSGLRDDGSYSGQDMSSDELYHYGVLGMRWGHRKNPIKSIKEWYNTSPEQKRKKKLRQQHPEIYERDKKAHDRHFEFIESYMDKLKTDKKFKQNVMRNYSNGNENLAWEYFDKDPIWQFNAIEQYFQKNPTKEYKSILTEYQDASKEVFRLEYPLAYEKIENRKRT